MGPKNPWNKQTGIGTPEPVETVSGRTDQSYNGRARTRECVDSDSGDDAETRTARESTTRGREQSGEVLRRCRQARGEKRRFVNKGDGERTMKALKDAAAKTLEGVAKLDKNHEHSSGMQEKDELSADLTALEKKGLDRKINHQGLMKAETQPRRRSRHLGEKRCDRGLKFVVACILVRGARGHKPRTGEEIPPLYDNCTQSPEALRKCYRRIGTLWTLQEIENTCREAECVEP